LTAMPTSFPKEKSKHQAEGEFIQVEV